ncbi:MAG: glycerophosphoryl diester phosphodiesterase [Frankiaceae bacterium]|nr:glycerophosphoryl diester phosphodiesterase [Frankiaceae bacterium]
MTLAFAHRGAPGPGQRENTLPAFCDAVAAGLTALESDVWLTADDVPVLVHDGVLWSRHGRRRIRDLRSDELPASVPTLADLYAAVGPVVLSLDLKDPDAAEAVLAVADAAGATGSLWLCAEAPLLRDCRARSEQVRLANSTRLRGRRLIEPLVARLAEAAVDALNLRAPEWTPARVRMTHAAGLRAFAWDVQTPQVLDRVLGDGCDAVYSDSVTLLLGLHSS